MLKESTYPYSVITEDTPLGQRKISEVPQWTTLWLVR